MRRARIQVVVETMGKCSARVDWISLSDTPSAEAANDQALSWAFQLKGVLPKGLGARTAESARSPSPPNSGRFDRAVRADMAVRAPFAIWATRPKALLPCGVETSTGARAARARPRPRTANRTNHRAGCK